MVISYTIQELTAIGEMVLLKECISRVNNEAQQNHQPPSDVIQPATSTTTSATEFLNEFAQYQQKLTYPIGFNRDSRRPQYQNHHYQPQQQQQYQVQPSDPPLTSSVAEFFKKAQQNFNPTNTIDPTKVRRLSDVEAELIRGDSR